MVHPAARGTVSAQESGNGRPAPNAASTSRIASADNARTAAVIAAKNSSEEAPDRNGR